MLNHANEILAGGRWIRCEDVEEFEDGAYFFNPADRANRIFLKHTAIDGWRFRVARELPTVPQYNPFLDAEEDRHGS